MPMQRIRIRRDSRARNLRERILECVAGACAFWLVTAACAGASAHGGTEYYRHVLFDNSAKAGGYWYSTAVGVAPSVLEEVDRRLPVEVEHFLTPPNALRIAWQSQAGGGWDAEIHLVDFRNRLPEFKGKFLYFWVYSANGISKADLPEIVLSDARDGLQVAQFPGASRSRSRWGSSSERFPRGNGRA
jgi:exo beta-1,2-glucooligosaccharide sophorohydrolase (non-reducing end)